MTTAPQSIRFEPSATVLLADTTLRDECLVDRAQQAVVDAADGDSIWRMTAAPAARIADMAGQLGRLGVDVIEAGFPASSQRGHAAAAAVARRLSSAGDPVVSAVIPLDGDVTGAAIARAWDAVRHASRPRLHLVTTMKRLTVDGVHLRHSDEIIEEARAAILGARGFTDDVEFSPAQVDGDRVGLVAAMSDAAISAGARTINVRTCSEPVHYEDRYRRLLVDLKRSVPRLASVVLSADCFSLNLRGAEASEEALRCARAAVELGARQVKCAIHGISATPGHVPLEELSVLASRGELGQLGTQVDHRELLATSAKVASIKGYVIEPSDPLVGDDLSDPSPRSFSGGILEREAQARSRAHLLRVLGRPVPAWLERPRFEWPLDELSGP